uniref:Uncharacterized protein n=1 Tax=Astyanax mexicanus TaxID=7994 RepID=A0A8B9KU21_ASTMX
MAGILSKRQARGVDFCGQGAINNYIVRSDLGCYMHSTDVHQGLNLKIYDLHPCCRGGDHYFANRNKFFIIKGNTYRCVSDLSKDSDAAVYDLHSNCTGGDHYLSVFGLFYIIFQSRGIFRQTNDLTTDSNGIEYNLHPNCRDGLYYWGTDDRFFFIKPKDQWGVHFRSNSNLLEDTKPSTHSVHADILNFVPGGLAITHGPAFRKWDLIKTIANDSVTPINWEKRITWKVGYTKSKSSSIEHNWNISASATYQSGTLTEAIAKFQFSLAVQYGGQYVDTENQSWEETSEMEEKLNMTMNPKDKIYVWQYKLGFGKETVLFCRDLRFDDDPNPPSEVPLPCPKCSN